MRHKTLYKKLHSFAPKLVGEKSMGQVMYWVRQMLKPHGVKVSRIIDDTNTALSGFTIGGFYDPSAEYDEPDIEMYMVFNEEDKHKSFHFEPPNVQLMINEVFTCLVHEKRHRYQFRKRGNAYGPQYRTTIDDADLKVELEYYGDPDEMDAYAQEAVIEERLYGKPSPTQEKYRELFASFDVRLYKKFLKRKYKFEQKVSL